MTPTALARQRAQGRCSSSANCSAASPAPGNNNNDNTRLSITTWSQHHRARNSITLYYCTMRCLCWSDGACVYTIRARGSRHSPPLAVLLLLPAAYCQCFSRHGCWYRMPCTQCSTLAKSTTPRMVARQAQCSCPPRRPRAHQCLQGEAAQRCNVRERQKREGTLAAATTCGAVCPRKQPSAWLAKPNTSQSGQHRHANSSQHGWGRSNPAHAQAAPRSVQCWQLPLVLDAHNEHTGSVN